MSDYREFAPPAGLVSVVACLWENDGIRWREQRVIPVRRLTGLTPVRFLEDASLTAA